MTQPSRANAVLPTRGVRGNHTANPSGRGPPGRAGHAPRTATRSPRPQQTPQNRPPRPGRFNSTCSAEAAAWAGFLGALGKPWPEPATAAPRPAGRHGPALQALWPEGPGDQALRLGGRIPLRSDRAGRWPCPHTSHHRPPLPSRGPALALRGPQRTRPGARRSEPVLRHQAPRPQATRLYAVRECRVCKGECVGVCRQQAKHLPPPQPHSPRGHPPGPGPRSPPAGCRETKGQRRPEGPVLAGPGRSLRCALHPAWPAASSPRPEGCDCSMV